MGAVLGVRLRNYGFTDLPPSLPLPRSDPVTRIYESSYRRIVNAIIFSDISISSIDDAPALPVAPISLDTVTML